jgi:hypothetical protein
MMPPRGPKGYAFNRTRTTYLATDLLIARTHWSRFRGLMATSSSHFFRGQGLWINPSSNRGAWPPFACMPLLS